MERRVDREAIHEIRDVLDRVLEKGCIFHPDMTKTATLKPTTLQNMAELLTILQEAITPRISAIQTPLCFDKLPVELLTQMILTAIPSSTIHTGEKDWSPANSHEIAIKLSHVSSRFRAVVLNTPDLWTDIYSTWPIEKQEAFLKRSKTHPLAIRLAGPPETDPPSIGGALYSKMVKALLRNAERWGCAHIDPHTLGALRSAYHNLSLPCLWKLDLWGSLVDDIPSGWDTPVLSTIAMPVFQGMPVPRNQLKPSVTDCKLYFFGDTFDAGFTMPYLNGLCRSPNLNGLFISFYDKLSEPDVQPLFSPPSYKWTNITRFRLYISYEPRSGLCISNLDLPNLEELRLITQEDILAREGGWKLYIDSLRRSKLFQPKLRRLAFEYNRFKWTPNGDNAYKIIDNGNNSHLELLDDILQKAPYLETLIIEASSLKPPAYDYILKKTGQNPFSHARQLRTLCYHDCKAVTNDYLDGLVRCLKDSPSWVSFASLVVDQTGVREVELEAANWAISVQKAGKMVSYVTPPFIDW